MKECFVCGEEVADILFKAHIINSHMGVDGQNGAYAHYRCFCGLHVFSWGNMKLHLSNVDLLAHWAEACLLGPQP